MASEDPIAVKILGDLKGSQYACTALTRLSGGTANFVYRGILRFSLPDGTTSIFIKHAEPYLATNTSWELSVIRSVQMSPSTITEHC